MKIERVKTRRLTEDDHARFAIANERLRLAQEAWNRAGLARPFDKAAEVAAWNELQAADKAWGEATRT